jgi:hypothetical protein
MDKTIRLMTVEELRAEAAFWRQRAIAAISAALGLAFLILCFGIGQLF